MRVDVIDILRLKPSILQRRPHRAFATFAVFRRGRDVMRVARQAIAQHFGIDLGTARLGVLVFFQDHDARALTHDETVTVHIIGAAGFLGVVAAFGRQRLAGVETRHADLTDRRLGAACDHHIRIAVFDQTRRVTDGMGPGGTSSHDRVVRPLETVADRDLTRDQVDQRAGHEEGAHAARTLFGHHDSSIGDRVQSTDARADQHAGAFLIFFLGGQPARILNRLLGGGHAEQNEGIYLPLLFRLHVFVCVKGAIAAIAQRHFAGVLGHQFAGIKAGDRSGPGLPIKDPFPAFFHAVREGGNQTQTRYYNSAHLSAPCR